MPHWKPSRFLVDDAPQEFKALQLVICLVPILYLFFYMLFDIFHKIIDYFKCILCCTNPIHSWRFYCICVLIKVIWGMDKVLIYLCYWHVLKAWRLRGIEKIKDVEMQDGILQDFHDVFINHG